MQVCTEVTLATQVCTEVTLVTQVCTEVTLATQVCTEVTLAVQGLRLHYHNDTVLTISEIPVIMI